MDAREQEERIHHKQPELKTAVFLHTFCEDTRRKQQHRNGGWPRRCGEAAGTRERRGAHAPSEGGSSCPARQRWPCGKASPGPSSPKYLRDARNLDFYVKASNFKMLAQKSFKQCVSQMQHWDRPNLACGPWFGTTAVQHADERGSEGNIGTSSIISRGP